MGKLDRAFEAIWDSYEDLIISGIYSNTKGDFAGTLGEFSGAVLLHYITDEGDKTVYDCYTACRKIHICRRGTAYYPGA
jgi:hypothetical protein